MKKIFATPFVRMERVITIGKRLIDLVSRTSAFLKFNDEHPKIAIEISAIGQISLATGDYTTQF